MQQIILAIILGILAGCIGCWFLLNKNKQEDKSILLMQEQLKEIRNTLDVKLTETANSTNRQFMAATQIIQQQFGESSKIIRDVTEKLMKIDETNRQVVNFADQLKSLQDILKNPKQRGLLGEYYLESALKNILPPNHYQMQYKFSDGEIVDAVIYLDKNKVLPIDAKFPLENYNRIIRENDPLEKERIERQFRQDIKNRIDETSKYIRPAENTMDFAFMFIPAEAVFYDLLVNQVGAGGAGRDLIEYAFQQRRVIIVSPTSFLAYLQTVLQGLRALQIEESAREIRKRVEELGRHLKSYDEFMGKLGKNLSATVSCYNAASNEFRKIDKDILRITGEAMGIEPVLVEKPDLGIS